MQHGKSEVNMKSATSDPRSITSAQCRAGRALLKWSRDELARTSRVALRTIIDFERDARAPREATLDSLARALESAGVIFVEENGAGPGVRLRK
jgi:transcriptional regulator with XRE-family HTH domain